MNDGGTEKAAAGEDKGRLRILAVDDEALVLYYLTDLIEDLGHVALPAASAAEALALLEQGGPIDLLITDRSMPDMRGTDLALAVRERRPELPIILASGYGDNASSGGPDLPCLSKPFTISDLEMMITSLVQA